MGVGFTADVTKGKRLRLEVSDPKKKDENDEDSLWEVEVTAVVYFSNGDPAADEEVFFRLNGKPHPSLRKEEKRKGEQQETFPTDNQGRTDTILFRLPSGSHTVSAEVKNHPAVKSKKTIKLGEKKKLVPKHLYVHEYGSQGEYRLVAIVATEKGQFVPDVTVVAIHGSKQKEEVTFTLKDKNRYTCDISFEDDAWRIYDIIVLGTDIPKKTVNLFGPLARTKKSKD